MPGTRRSSRKKKRRMGRFQPYPMTDVEGASYETFAATGRTGRRNALADITDPNYASTSTADLPEGMHNLSCTDADSEATKLSTASAGAETVEEKKNSKDEKTAKDAEDKDKPDDKKEKEES